MVAFHDSCHDRGHRRGSGKVLRVMEAERAACVSALRSPSPIPFPAGGQETTSVPEVASHRCASVYHLSLCPPQLRAMRRDWPPCCCTSRGPVSLGCPRPPCWHTCRMSSARQRAGTEQGGLTPGLLCLPQAPTSGAPQATAQDGRGRQARATSSPRCSEVRLSLLLVFSLPAPVSHISLALVLFR